MIRLTYPAPRRCSHEISGGYYTSEWTLRDVLEYVFSAGGRFVKSGHDFDCEETAKVATDPKTYEEVEYD